MLGSLVTALGGATLGFAAAAWLYRRRLRALAADGLLHNLNPALIARGRARAAPRRRASSVFVRADGKFARVVRIALTGGPCGGKSSVLSHLMRTATAAGYDVLVVPETATILFNGGVQFPASEEDQVNFQAQLMRMQLAGERAFTSIAERTGRPTIIVMDRGLLDGKGYLRSPELWRSILERHAVDEAYLLGRYDAVVHLATSADGAEPFYKSGDVVDDDGRAVFRRESAEEARALDLKMRECWAAHVEHHVIGNAGYRSFDDKMRAATDAVMAVARRLQPPSAPGPRPRTAQNSQRHDDDMPGVPRRV
ncbi:hypothetical protein KFE25_010647 [Diacronema lutheri]|uniref:NadR/Ttd14 AAA domain-containing protein n=2 Tax=Diacronema lutheri TaxID=2081491 RepID=A0A8J6C7C5_DIALT|nr:hypothetical protein KFE25_010647 [Diacronema lutheri]